MKEARLSCPVSVERAGTKPSCYNGDGLQRYNLLSSCRLYDHLGCPLLWTTNLITSYRHDSRRQFLYPTVVVNTIISPLLSDCTEWSKN